MGSSDKDIKCFDKVNSKVKREVVDNADNFDHVYTVSDYIYIDKQENKMFEDESRFVNINEETGYISYMVPKGINSIELTTYSCVPNNAKLTIVPYLKNTCKPLVVTLTTKEEEPISDCWYKQTRLMYFDQFMPCPPIYVDIVISEGNWDTLQISSITLETFGDTEQDLVFGQDISQEDRVITSSSSPSIQYYPNTNNTSNLKINESTNSSTSSDSNILVTPDDASISLIDLTEKGNDDDDDDHNSSSNDSENMKSWLLPLIVSMCLIFGALVIIITIRTVQESDTLDFDGISQYFSKIPELFKRKSNTGETTLTNSNKTIRRSMPGASSSNGTKNTRLLMNKGTTEFVNSVTFDDGIKGHQEKKGAVGVGIRHDAVEDQLVDLSQVLHKSLWASKFVKRQQVLVIEDLIGKVYYSLIYITLFN